MAVHEHVERHPTPVEMTPHSMPDSNEFAIVVESLTKRYGALQAVDGVSFSVRSGDVFAFVGPNGAGKTTTVEIIETVRSPTSGRVTVLGMDVTSRKREIIPRIGVLPQGFASFDRITVRESIRYYARLFGCRHADIDGLIDLANLKDKADAQFKTLSGGLKQRLGIAIALVNDPEVVFLDEPTTGLDPHARRAVWDVLLGLKRQGKTVFLTTHYMEEAELLADTVAVISSGKIVAIGSPGELIERHKSDMRLTLRSADARVLQALRALHFEPVADSRDNITVRVRDAHEVHAILSALMTADLPLPGMEVRKPSLEDTFLHLTQGPLGNGAPTNGRRP